LEVVAPAIYLLNIYSGSSMRLQRELFRAAKLS